jgi:phytoene dehydrogenase-like protein
MNLRPISAGKYDAVIIGGSIGGLVAASYLARGDARVLLLERSDRFGGRAETVELGHGFRAALPADNGNAFDLRVLRDLHLGRHGLQRGKQDMKIIALRPGGTHIHLSPRASPYARFRADGQGGPAYAAFLREALGWAQRLRRAWDGTLDLPEASAGESDLTIIARRLQLSDRDWERIGGPRPCERGPLLNRWFEDDALQAALSLEVFPSGLCPAETGSALVLIWRYGQAGARARSAASRIHGGPGRCCRGAGGGSWRCRGRASQERMRQADHRGKQARQGRVTGERGNHCREGGPLRPRC